MGVRIEIPNVPEDVHRTLKARATLAEVSLSEYVCGVLVRTASRPSPAELSARLKTRGTPTLTESSEATVRLLRDR